MKAGWQTTPFEDCIEQVTYTTKIQRKDFLSEGAFPIVSQEEDLINGRWENEADLFKVERPLVLFGDHTRSFKYVDFDFVLGADGVKILKPKTFLHPRYFYFQLQTAKLESLGYARHFRLLKEHSVSYPDFAEQHRIVTLLDEAFADIATAKANAEKNLQNAREVFETHLRNLLNARVVDGIDTTLQKCCDQIFAGGDVPKDRVSNERTATYPVPIFSNGAKDDGLYGFTDTARVTKPSVTVSARGTLGFSAIRNEPFLPVVRLIVLTPNENLIDLSFLHYTVLGMDFENTGTSIPQLTVPNFKDLSIYLPPLAKQKELVLALDSIRDEIQTLESIYRQKFTSLDDLKKSLLHQAFSGQL